MKKFTALLLVLVLAAGLLSGCGSKDERVVYVYNWGEYMDESLNDEFTAKTGIKVVYDYFDTNEALYALLKGGSAEYDVRICSPKSTTRNCPTTPISTTSSRTCPTTPRASTASPTCGGFWALSTTRPWSTSRSTAGISCGMRSTAATS